MNQEEIDAWWAEVERLTDLGVPATIEYRLYYNEQGDIVLGTMIVNDTAYDYPYLVVTKEEYDTYFHYSVVNGKLKRIDTDAGYRVQLIKSDTGFLVVKNHAGLLIEPGETYNNTEYYGHRNN